MKVLAIARRWMIFTDEIDTRHDRPPHAETLHRAHMAVGGATVPWAVDATPAEAPN